jgi:hypothetical protein
MTRWTARGGRRTGSGALAGVGPGGSNRYGDTAEEQRAGEPLDYRLRQEEPDVGAEDPLPPAPTRSTRPSTAPSSATSTRTCGGRAHLGSGLAGVALRRRPARRRRSGTVGRLVEPDEGYGFDNERDSVAYDAGAAGGGASAEELAMHETNAPTTSRFRNRFRLTHDRRCL